MYVNNRLKAEVNSARVRLDATLQSLVDKKDDSESTADSDDDPDLPLPVSVQVVRSSGSPAASPSKHSRASSSRRRKRKHDSSDATDAGSKYHSTAYVMKLFDRSVDLSKFSEKTPLYPIARAWIKDRTPEDTDASQEESEPEDQSDPANVFKMPDPIKLKFEKDESYNDGRIPPPLLCDDPHLDIHKDPDLGPAPEELLLSHMARWKTIRQLWVSAARVHELKFNSSMAVLKDIYDKNLSPQEG